MSASPANRRDHSGSCEGRAARRRRAGPRARTPLMCVQEPRLDSAADTEVEGQPQDARARAPPPRRSGRSSRPRRPPPRARGPYPAAPRAVARCCAPRSTPARSRSAGRAARRRPRSADTPLVPEPDELEQPTGAMPVGVPVEHALARRPPIAPLRRGRRAAPGRPRPPQQRPRRRAARRPARTSARSPRRARDDSAAAEASSKGRQDDEP